MTWFTHVSDIFFDIISKKKFVFIIAYFFWDEINIKRNNLWWEEITSHKIERMLDFCVDSFLIRSPAKPRFKSHTHLNDATSKFFPISLPWNLIANTTKRSLDYLSPASYRENHKTWKYFYLFTLRKPRWPSTGLVLET